MSRRQLELAAEEVPSAQYLSIVWKHRTESLCQEVFAATRERERQRKWTLYALLQSRYGSQTRALLGARAGPGLFPPVDAGPGAFLSEGSERPPGVLPERVPRLYCSAESRGACDVRAGVAA